MIAKMNTKNLMVSFCTLAIAFFLVATVSATSTQIADDITVEVDGITVYTNGNYADNASVIAGEDTVVKVYFTSLIGDPESDDDRGSDVRIKAEIEGDKVDVDAMTSSFDVEENHTYKKTLTLEVPFELKDQVSDDVTLNLKIWNGDYKTEVEDIVLRVQRPSYNPVVKSVSVPQSIDAGENFPVDLVLKNMGYNDLDDIYVKVSIPALGLERTGYFGDLAYLESCEDDCEEEDTVSGRLYLEVPYEAEAGIYTLEVEVTNDDVTAKVAKQIVIDNNLAENVIVSSSSKTVAVGQDAEYTLLLVNPTNDLRVYKIVTESNSQVSSSTEDAVVAVPAGSSKTVTVTASAEKEGQYDFDVTVLSGEKVVSTVALSLNAEGKAVSNPIVVLTVVLAIIFLVLLVVLIVLLGKKPQKAEEFGESYY